MGLILLRNIKIWLFQKVGKSQHKFYENMFDNFIEHLDHKLIKNYEVENLNKKSLVYEWMG